MTIKPYVQTLVDPLHKTLDLGSGRGDYSDLAFNTTTVDAWEGVDADYYIDLEKEKLPFEDNSFDTVMMIDFIEHLEKEAGLRLIEDCKKIARKRIVLFTPLFWTDNSENVENPDCWAYGNPYDYHKSLWTQEDFESTGWKTFHIFGLPNRRQWLGYWEK